MASDPVAQQIVVCRGSEQCFCEGANRGPAEIENLVGASGVILAPAFVLAAIPAGADLRAMDTLQDRAGGDPRHRHD